LNVARSSKRRLQRRGGGFGPRDQLIEIARLLPCGRTRFFKRAAGQLDLAGEGDDRPPEPAVERLQIVHPPRQNPAIPPREERGRQEQAVHQHIHRLPLAQFITNSVTSRSRTRPSPVTTCTRRSICARRRMEAAGSSRSFTSTARR